ncbi:MAG: protein-L-isoaspartate O-methyltransferase [Parvibaculum sp.]|jgi:protein-L-isoaspartate(D-aspartate) O-methyltransferase
MHDFNVSRLNMVESQVRCNGVTDSRVIDAMGSVPRERFVAPAMASLAYMDSCVAIGDGSSHRHIMEPRVFAKLLQLAAVESDDMVLDVGCGSGYSTAVLAHLAQAVVGLESQSALADAANATLSALNLHNAAVVTGALNEGVAKQGPYDVILINGQVEQIPEALFDQLKEGGRLVAVVGSRTSARARLYVRSDGRISARDDFDAQIAALPGFEQKTGFVF